MNAGTDPILVEWLFCAQTDHFTNNCKVVPDGAIGQTNTLIRYEKRIGGVP